MKPKFRIVLETALESGIRCGYTRAHKHTDNPDVEIIVDAMINEIFNSLDEWFDFNDDFSSIS
jgi:hypothetical protein